MQIKYYLTILLLVCITYNVFAQDTTKAKQEFKPSGKLWGYVFGDYYYKTHADSLGRGTGEYSNMKEGANAFEFRRIYLGYDYQISQNFSAELLLSHEKNYDANSNRTVFIKSANVRWKNFIPKNDLVIGQSASPIWPLLTEKIWSYRSVERMPEDIHKLGNSNDVGIAIHGKIDSAGNFGYNLMAGNGTTSKAETDIFKKFYGEVYAKFFKQKLILDFYADFERKQLVPYRKEYTTYKIFLAYHTKRFTIGAEAYYQFVDNTIKSQNNVTHYGIALFSRISIMKEKLTFILRKDFYLYTPYLSTLYRQSEDFLLAGIDYTPNRNIHIIPNIWITSYFSENPALPVKVRQDYDLVPRLTIHYIFK